MRKSKITTLLLALASVCVMAFFGACEMFHTPFDPILDGEEVFVYDQDGNRVDQDGVFLSIGTDTYYVQNNMVAKGYQVIEKSIYNFGETGKMTVGEKDGYTFGQDGKLVADEMFVDINEDTYYLENNVVVNYDVVIESSLYFFNEDGTMFKGEMDGNVFGEDGKLVVEGDVFVTVNNNTYYIQNNIVVTGTLVLDGYFYNFGENGKMIVGDFEGYTYGEDGKLIGDKIFVTINNNTYYIENNIVIFGSVILDGYIYDFGEDGKMVIGDKDGNTYDENGKLIGDEIFVTINNSTYYVINNVIVKGSIIINGSFYQFNEDGTMFVGTKDGYTYGSDGKLIANEVFVVINNNTYYIENNVVVTGTVIINGSFYDFGETGEMVVGEKGDYTYGEDGRLVADEVFVVINNNTYYIVNNIVVTGTIVIDGYLYDFGETGEMFVGEKNGYTYGDDGKLVADQVFVTINNNTYYIVNNIVITGSVQIDGSFYQFNEDGTMFVGTKDGYTYGSDGKLIANEVFVTINNNVYYIVNNVTVHGYIVIDGYIYNFEDDGKMFKGEKDGYTFNDEGKLVGNEIFVTINNNTYYIENNVTLTNTIKIIDDQLYIFDETGKQVTSGEYGDIEFDENGNIVGDCVEIVVGGDKYYVVNNVVVGTVTVQGVVYESDNDLNPANNAKVSGVTCTATIGETTFTAVTDANGEYIFQKLPATTIVFSFARDGYITASITVDCSTLTGAYTVVIDKEVHNNLVGKVVKADTDTDASNNSGLSGATLRLTRTSSTNVWEYTTTTSSNGSYTFTDLTAGVYTLTIEKEGYLTITQTVQVRYNETTVQNITLEAIPEPSSPDVEVENGYAAGVITDGRTGYSISGLTVYVYAGINNTVGDVLCTVTTNGSGAYTTTALAPGNYTAYVVDERELSDENLRYAPVTIALKVLSGVTISGQNTNTSNSVGMSIDGMRIVLTWGSSPRDLDSHLLAGSYHIYYSTKSGGDCNLDVDDTNGYGPETTTISTVNTNWVYKYYVYNYSSGGSSSYDLSNSNATIKIYFGATLAYAFNVPYAYGCYWNVFTYDARTGEFTVINEVSSSPLS